MKSFGSAARLCASVIAAAAAAGVAHAGDLHISHPWVRPTPPGALAAAGYLKIANTGQAADRLLGGSTPLAGRVEVHEMSMAGGVMTMRPLADGLPVPAGGSVTLKPGGYHLMLISPVRQLKPGDKVPMTLRFERAGAVRVEFKVEPPPAMSGMTTGGR